MADDPLRNARKLVQVVVEHFAFGATALDLRLRYEDETGLRNASFFNALRLAKENQWLIGGGRGQLYELNSNGAWKEALKLLEGLEKDRLEVIVDLQAGRIERLEAKNRKLVGSRKAIDAGETAGSTVATLTQLMVDSSLTMRRRISAAQLLLGFKSPEDVQQHTKQFLHSVFLDHDMDISLRLEAAELLRRSEDARIAPAVERPTVAVQFDTPEEIAERSARQRAHVEAQAARNAEELARERQRFASERSSRRLPGYD
jgi:hypothetical protein